MYLDLFCLAHVPGRCHSSLYTIYSCVWNQGLHPSEDGVFVGWVDHEGPTLKRRSCQQRVSSIGVTSLSHPYRCRLATELQLYTTRKFVISSLASAIKAVLHQNTPIRSEKDPPLKELVSKGWKDAFGGTFKTAHSSGATVQSLFKCMKDVVPELRHSFWSKPLCWEV